jgi:H+/Cl- antiporter ClcA
MFFMAEQSQNSSPLRMIAAVMLGIIIGTILFFIVALFIGAFNDIMGTRLSVSTNFAENVWSLILLVVFNLIFIAAFCWMVRKTPPSEPESEEDVQA